MSDPGWQASSQANTQSGDPGGGALSVPMGGGAVTATAFNSDNTYPVTCALDTPLERTNLQPFISYLLAIPHLLLLGLYGIVAFFNAIVAWFSIVLNGSPPENARNNIAAFQRYWFRVLIPESFIDQTSTRSSSQFRGTPIPAGSRPGSTSRPPAPTTGCR